MSYRRKHTRRTGRGVAPRTDEPLDFSDTHSHSKGNNNYKDLQLCRQAFRVISLTMAGGYGNELIADLVVRSVLPAPDASRLLVILEAPATPKDESIDLPRLIDALERHRPQLRHELATSLVRKRAPELEFVVVPRSEVES